MFYLSGWLVLIYMVLYEPNFSLMFSIHLYLYAGVYCIIIPKKRMDQLKHQDIIIGGMGINQTDSNLHKHLFRTNLFVALWGQKFAYKILKLSKPRQRHKLSYSHDALQTIIGESSLKKMRFRGQRIHWFHVNGSSIHVKKKRW